MNVARSSAAGVVAPSGRSSGVVSGTAERICDLLAATRESLGATSVGLMLLDEAGRARTVAAGGDAAARLGSLQESGGPGPGVDSLLSGAPTSVGDLLDERRYAALWPEARTLGLRAVLSAPVRAVPGPGSEAQDPLAVPSGTQDPGQVIGTLQVIHDHVHAWSPTELETVVAYAKVVAALLQLTASSDLSGGGR